MKTRQEKESAVGSQFDELAKTLADGLTRRKTLQLISGSLTGVLVSLGIPKTWGAPGNGNGKGCGQICAPLFNPHNQAVFAACTTTCENCKSCSGTPSFANGALVCAGATPCSGTCCPATAECCGGACLQPCAPGKVRNPDCTCGGPNFLRCFCGDGAVFDTCSQVNCDLGPPQDVICGPLCASHNGERATACFGPMPICAAT